MMFRGPVWTMLLAVAVWGAGSPLLRAQPGSEAHQGRREESSGQRLWLSQSLETDSDNRPSSPPDALTRPTLSLGSSGPLVIQIQLLLQQKGHYSGSVDGQFSVNTAAAVKAFQAQSGLEETGAVDSATWGPLTGESPAPDASGNAEVTETQTSSPPAGSPPPEVAASSPPVSGRRLPRNGAIAVALFGLGAGSFGLWKILAAPRPDAPDDRYSKSPDPDTELDVAVAQALQSEQHRQEEAPSLGNAPGAQATSRPPAPSAGIASSLMPPPPSKIAVPQSSRLAASQLDTNATRLARLDIVEVLVTDLQSAEPAKRRKAIWELGQRADSRAIQPLVNLMASSDSRQRSLILAALSEIGTQTLKPMKQALAMSLQDESAEVRKNAIRDLTRIYDLVAQISHLLTAAVNDPDPEVQETARWALGQLNRIRSNAGLEAGAAPQLLQQSVSPPESFSDDVPLKLRQAQSERLHKMQSPKTEQESR